MDSWACWCGGVIPYSFRVVPATGVLVVTCSGALALNDAIEGAKLVWGNPDWSGRPVVWDFRLAQMELRAPEVRELAEYVLERQPSMPPPRVALVTNRNPDFGFARMFEVFRENSSTEVRVFRDFDEALSWAQSTRLGAT